MRCPYCAHPESKVIDSRPIADGNSIRRRRECFACGKRFNTFEMVESVEIIVIKKDGTKELFDKTKLLSGLLKACQKRPVKAEDIVSDIENELHTVMKNEITTKELGEMVMDKLKEIDEVSYVRFASVYREFKDIDTFLAELRELRSESFERSREKK